MHYVILRDDDTNALTPVDQLEELYRPFLQLGLPVNLAVIPNVRTDAVTLDGRREGFLPAPEAEEGRGDPVAGRDRAGSLVAHRLDSRCVRGNGSPFSSVGDHLKSVQCRETQRLAHLPGVVPIGSNKTLVDYLRNNPGYHVVQHGYHHGPREFACRDVAEIRRRFDHGGRLFAEAGLARPETFVAPHDTFSRTSLREAARRFRVISTGWYESGRLPLAWWPNYGLKKILQHAHWQIGGTRLLSHPGCMLSCYKPSGSILEAVQSSIASRRLTVLVTHWWEYFRGGAVNTAHLGVLHELAEWLSRSPKITVVSFQDVADGWVPLN